MKRRNPDPEREAAFAAVRQEIPDFDARVEKERAKMAARKVETAKGHGGARDGAGRKAKGEDVNQSVNCALKKPKPGKSNADPERVIARLKRDAATDPKAEALLQQVAGNNISARQATLLPAEHWPVNATIVALLVNSYRPLPTASRYMQIASNPARVRDLAPSPRPRNRGLALAEILDHLLRTCP